MSLASGFADDDVDSGSPPRRGGPGLRGPGPGPAAASRSLVPSGAGSGDRRRAESATGKRPRLACRDRVARQDSRRAPAGGREMARLGSVTETQISIQKKNGGKVIRKHAGVLRANGACPLFCLSCGWISFFYTFWRHVQLSLFHERSIIS